ncbi:MAG: phytoene/squalene synthase family protein [Gemmataceae bacterium]
MKDARIDRSFAYCEALTKREARHFYPAFGALTRDQRRAMCAIYAFMRVTDDLADGPGEPETKRIALSVWREELYAALAGEPRHELHSALAHTVVSFNVPVQHLIEVLDGVCMDLEPVRVEDFNELYRYCYHVASAVGLACIHIWGFTDEEAKKHAEAAGVALQLTNILRDLGEDRSRGRIYLPADELVRFDCPPERWDGAQVSFRAMMQFQTERARKYYAQAEPLTSFLKPSGAAVFQTILRTYRSLLDEIVRRQYDVFSSRVRLSRWRRAILAIQALSLRWGLSG